MTIDNTPDTTKTSHSQLDKSLPVKARVKINGENVLFVSLQIEQAFGEHSFFIITLDHKVLQQSFMNSPYEQLNIIGARVVIEFYHENTKGNTYLFKGMVTDVEMIGGRQAYGNIVLKGASYTILLERGRRSTTFSDMTLRQIFNQLTEVTSNQNEYISIINDPTYEANVSFLMQYNESEWEFIKRICYQFGVNLLYSGKDLIIGKYEDSEAVPLMYDNEITAIKFCSKLLPNNFTNYEYIADRDEAFEWKTSDIKNANRFVREANDRNSSILNVDLRFIDSIPSTALDISLGEIGLLNELGERKQERTAAQTVYIIAEANTYESTIGRLINVTVPENMTQANGLGTYRVVKSTHSIDEAGVYRNTFEAVPSKLQTMPMAEPKMPIADSVLATVTSTDDPMGQGRVQVTFDVSKRYPNQAWLRVLTPDGGVTASGEKNRGLVFVPEKGSQVLINFMSSNPNLPYVAGAFYHGKNGQGGGENNAIKSIVTRSGIQIVFNDDAKSLYIQDANGCVWNMDGKGNIEVIAPESITFNTKNMTVNATENIKMVTRNISEEAETISYQVKKGINFEADKVNSVLNKLNVTTTGNSSIISNAKMEIKGAKIDLAQGSGAKSPKSPQAVNGLPAATTTASAAQKKKDIFEERKDDNEREGANPNIISIKLMDNDGNETDTLWRSTNVEVITKEMAGRDLELVLHDNESDEDINVGTFYIPTNDYVVKTQIKNREDYKSK